MAKVPESVIISKDYRKDDGRSCSSDDEVKFLKKEVEENVQVFE